ATGWIFVMTLPQLGPLMLERVTGLAEVGYFGAAYRIPALLSQAPRMLGTALYPVLFESGARDPVEHLRISARQVRFMSAFGLGLAMPLGLYPSLVMEMLLGKAWVSETSLVLALLAWFVAFQSISGPLGDALTTQGLLFRRAGVLAAAFGGGIVVYRLLGARWGAYGAAAATLIVEAIVLVGFAVVSRRSWAALTSGLPPLALGGATMSALALRVATGPCWLGLALTPVVFSIVAVCLDRELRRGVFAVSAALNSRSRRAS